MSLLAVSAASEHSATPACATVEKERNIRVRLRSSLRSCERNRFRESRGERFTQPRHIYLPADPAVEVVLEVVPLGLGEAPARLEVERQPAHLHQHTGLAEPSVKGHVEL